MNMRWFLNTMTICKHCLNIKFPLKSILIKGALRLCDICYGFASGKLIVVQLFRNY